MTVIEPGPAGPGPAEPGTADEGSAASVGTAAMARGSGACLWAVLGLGALAVVFSALGVHHEPVAALTLLFLLAGPGAALAWALPAQELPLRLLLGIFGGLAADAVIALVMLTMRWWSPSGGALAALALSLALLALGAFGTRRAQVVADPRTGLPRPSSARPSGDTETAPDSRSSDYRGSAAP